MGSTLKDLTGQEFGQLKVEAREGTQITPNGTKQTLWLCRCRCGASVVARSNDLRRQDGKAIQACQTCARTKHGHTKGKQSPTYVSWHAMLTRCQRDPDYQTIPVCERWREFNNFLTDMGERPSKHHTIDRIQGHLGYEPGNCRWATKTEQNRNMKTNLWLEINGERLILADWLQRFQLNVQTYYARRRRGLSPVEALTNPNH